MDCEMLNGVYDLQKKMLIPIQCVVWAGPLHGINSKNLAYGKIAYLYLLDLHGKSHDYSK